MLKLEDFKQFEILNKRNLQGGDRIIQIDGFSNGETAYAYESGDVEYCNDDNNDDFRVVNP